MGPRNYPIIWMKYTKLYLKHKSKHKDRSFTASYDLMVKQLLKEKVSSLPDDGKKYHITRFTWRYGIWKKIGLSSTVRQSFFSPEQPPQSLPSPLSCLLMFIIRGSLSWFDSTPWTGNYSCAFGWQGDRRDHKMKKIDRNYDDLK